MVLVSLLDRIDIPETNVASYVLDNCERIRGPDHTVFLDSATGYALTVAELRSYVRRLAAGLRQHFGIKRGDVVAIFASNSVNFPIVVYGVVASGATCTTVNPTYTPRELEHQLTDSQATMIVVGGGLLDTALEAFSHMDDSAKPKHILHMDEARTGMEDSIFSAMVDETAGPVDDGLQPSDYSTTPAYICYSSGTTGLPKGVLLSHRNMVANAMQIQRVKQLDLERSQGSRHEIFLGLAPFCHAYGLSYVLHSSVALGGTIVIMSRYSFDGFLKAIERHRITFAYLVPPLVCALSKDPRVDDYNVSSMHTILSGGATLSPTLIEATQKRLPHVRVIQGYGMTEMSPAITMLATSHNEPASIGILMANCEAKVVDHDNNEVAAPGEPGELCFRGPNIMVGYLNNRRATEAIFDSDGFLYTGDIGYVDSKGFFFITDRKKEIIKFKGFQISPSELESILAEHPDIADAAVMPVYDDSQATEVPKGFFVMKDSGNNDQERAKAVVEWLHERVAGFKRLRGGFVIIDHIPRSPAGKIIRKSLREIQHVNLGKATAAA